MLTRGNWRQALLFILICILFIGLVFSRAVLSIATIAFASLLFSNGSFKRRINIFLRTPIYIIVSALFVIPLVSGLWSNDKATWLSMMTTKLPLLLFPLAFAQGFYLSKKQWKNIALVFLLVVFAATLYSSAIYISNTALYNAAYKQAKVLPTPMHGDHLRFSLLVSIAILLAFFLCQKSSTIWSKRLLVLLSIWFFFYLHLLAARTGLLCAYLILFAIIAQYSLRQKRGMFSFLFLLFFILLPLVAWFTIPTFKTRLQYIRYDLTQVFYGHYVPGTSDGSRALSLRGGWQILKGSPLGVGLGDIKYEMNEWYGNAEPGMAERDKLYPSSEWMVHGLIAGWIGIFLFTMIIAGPFFLEMRHRFWWWMLNTVLACSILFDTGLSTQFGIFMYAFFILVWWQYSRSVKDPDILAREN